MNRKYESTEEAQIDLQQMVIDNAKSLNLDVVLMDKNNFQSNETQKYNDFVTLNNWISERALHLENEMEMVNIHQNQLDDLQQKYGTKYVSWLGYTGIRRKKDNVGIVVCLSLLTFYAIPYGIYYVATPEYDTNLYFVVFDIEKGEYVWLHTQKIGSKDSKSLVKGILYDIMYQIKNKR